MFTMDARAFNEKVMKDLFRKIYPVIAEQVLAHTGVRQGRAMDLGGGPGMLAVALAQRSQLSLSVVDPLEDCVQLARENIAEHGVQAQVEATLGRAEQLDFPEACMDLVVSRGSIYFWEDQQAGLREVWRVLRPGGWAHIGGGFGTRLLREEIMALKAGDEEWLGAMRERGRRNPPEHFQRLLDAAGIAGEVLQQEAGIWITFRKPGEGTP